MLLQIGLALLSLVLVAVGVIWLRRPVLGKMAARNAVRRPKQTATVIAGLMIGTAIISAALVAGDSAGSAIEEAVYDTLLGIDETVTIDGFPFFPEEVQDELASDPRVQDASDGVAPNIIWTVAGDNPRTDLFEPIVSMVGFDPVLDRPFGAFEVPSGTTYGEDLPADGLIASQELADELDLRIGDTLQVAYTLPVDPALPEITQISGQISGGSLPLPIPAESPADDVYEVLVQTGATQLTVAVAWDPSAQGLPPTQRLALVATSPDGTRYEARAPLGETQVPLFLNVTAGLEGLETGTWQVRVSAEAAVQADYVGAAIVIRPVYDLGAFEDFEGDGFADLLDAFQAQRFEADFTVHAISDGGKANQFDLPGAAFVRLDTLQELLQRQGQVNLVKISNPGGVRDSVAGSEAAVAAVEAVLEELDTPDAHPAIAALKVEPDKRDFLALAREASQGFTGFLLFAGSLSIITGLLLIVNIFIMLAEERRSELGMARAVGMPQNDVVRLFLFEGSLYAVAAAALGALLGVLLAWIMVLGLNALIASGDFPPIPFVVAPSNLLLAFCGGALLTFATIFFASRRASRINIVRAIRQIEEPDKVPSAWATIVGIPLAGLGLLGTIIGWMVSQFSLQVFGPLAIGLGVGMALRPYVRRRRLDPIIATVLGIYYAVTFFTISEFENATEANIIGPVRGVLMTFCVVLLITYWESGTRRLGRALSRFKRLRAIALPAMSYPQHKKFRTGMTLGMFSVVILSIGIFSIFGALFNTDPAEQTGGFDIEATTTLDVQDLAPYDRGLVPAGTIASTHQLADQFIVDPTFILVNGERTGTFAPQQHVYGYDEPFVTDHDFELIRRHDDYATDEAAYRAVLERDDVVIVGYSFSTDAQGRDLANNVGDPLVLDFSGGPREFTIIGIQKQFHFPGIFLSKDTVEDLFADPQPFYLMRLAEGVDATETAKLLEKNYRDVGMDAEASQPLVLEQQETFRQILGAMQLFLGLALVVGILSLGIITSRSVLERRQEIGMMRALGYTSRQIGLMFFLEVSLIIFLGALIGVACSLVVTYGLYLAVIESLQYPYTVPWLNILVVVGIAYVTALLATVAPILKGARTPPAEAVRYVE